MTKPVGVNYHSDAVTQYIMGKSSRSIQSIYLLCVRIPANDLCVTCTQSIQWTTYRWHWALFIKVFDKTMCTKKSKYNTTVGRYQAEVEMKEKKINGQIELHNLTVASCLKLSIYTYIHI